MSPPSVWTRLVRSRWSGIALTASLCAVYAHGGLAWMLGFVAWVPWLRTLDAEPSLRRTLLSAWAMSIGYVAAVLAWFGAALGTYTQIGEAAGLVVLLLAAPLLQPQILAFALVRHLARRRHGAALTAIAATAAYVATEWALPHGRGGSFGHGLYPAETLRQAAALVGGTGLTAVLLLSNEALAAAWARRNAGPRAAAPALAGALLGPLLLAGYGLFSATRDEPPATTMVRVGLVQANITGYEQRRREQGAEAVVREVLDLHLAMSYDAVEHQHVDAVLWSETVYPTTFGRPKSEAGAELDAELLATIEAAGVPFVFGTYDRDEAGEYNAAAFVQPGAGVIGRYRKTRLFPFTEALPAWLDTPTVRALLPGAGQWLAGDGARVFPLRLKNGREVPVLPLICLDDTDPRLAIDGARLGAQLILTMSNDEWFTRYPQGAALHQAVAAFRSLETGLPQFRVTTNGLSAVIDGRGRVLASGGLGERTLVIGELPARDPAPTLMVRWGDWVGRAAALLLAAWALWTAVRRAPAAPVAPPPALPADVVALSPAARAVTGALRGLSRGGALVIGLAWLTGDTTITGNTFALLRAFAALCLLPEAMAWWLLRSSRARLDLADGVLRLQRGTRTLTVPLTDIASVAPWRLPFPTEGASLRRRTGGPWPAGLSLRDPWALADAIGLPLAAGAARLAPYARCRAAHPGGRLTQPLLKFGLLPLLLALPAFTLHQNIAFGSPLGELHSYGLAAYLTAFALWWAAWVVGVVVCATVLRACTETIALVATLLRPAAAGATRTGLERLGLLMLYVGMPAWLLVRVTS